MFMLKSHHASYPYQYFDRFARGGDCARQRVFFHTLVDQWCHLGALGSILRDFFETSENAQERSRNSVCLSALRKNGFGVPQSLPAL